MAGPALPIGAHLQVPGQADYVTDDGDVRGGVHIVADTTARDAIPAAMRKQGMVARLYDGSEYSLGADLTTWTNISTATTSITEATGLAGIKALSSASSSPIIRVWRDSGKTDAEFWSKQPAATATADDITVVTVTDASCQFHRVIGSGPVAKWLAQAAWYVDATSGSDWDTGATGHALSTSDEIQRRWGANPVLPQTTAVNIAWGSVAMPSVSLKARGLDSTCLLTVQGVPSAAVTTTISVFVEHTHGTYGVSNPEATIVSGASISDWTSYFVFGNRLRSNLKLANFAKVNPAAGGVSTLRTQPWGTMSLAGTMTWSQTSPAVSDPLIVEKLPQINAVDIDFANGGSSTAVSLLVRDLAVVNSFRAATNGRGRVYGCCFASTCSVPQQYSIDLNFATWNSCEFRCNNDPMTKYYGCMSLNNGWAAGAQGVACQFYSCLMQGAGGHGFSCNGMGFVIISDWQTFDCSGEFILIDVGTILSMTGAVSGKSTTGVPAISLRQSARIQYSSIPNFISVGQADISIGSSGMNWTSVPSNGLRVGVWSGTGTLSSGLLPVSLNPSLPSIFVAGSSIKVGYKAPSNLAGLIGYDSVTTSGFRVVGSPDDSGSVVWWEATAAICRENVISQ